MLRGGSWFDYGGEHAFRRPCGMDEPGSRSSGTGFRFAPGQANSQEAEPVVVASERGKRPEKEGRGFAEKNGIR